MQKFIMTVVANLDLLIAINFNYIASEAPILILSLLFDLRQCRLYFVNLKSTMMAIWHLELLNYQYVHCIAARFTKFDLFSSDFISDILK